MHGYLTRNVLGTFEKQAPDHIANPLKFSENWLHANLCKLKGILSKKLWFGVVPWDALSNRWASETRFGPSPQIISLLFNNIESNSNSVS